MIRKELVTLPRGSCIRIGKVEYTIRGFDLKIGYMELRKPDGDSRWVNIDYVADRAQLLQGEE